MITRTIIENLLILIGESFWVASAYSQLSKLIKTKDKRGLSAVNMTLNTTANAAWLVYFATNHLWVGFVSNSIMFFMTGAIVFLLLSSKKQRYSGLVSIFTLGPLTAYLIIVYPGLSGWIGMAFNVIASTPWVIHVMRTKKTSGISEKAMYLAISATLSTMAYAFLINSGPLITGTLIGICYELIILRYYYRYRHAQ